MPAPSPQGHDTSAPRRTSTQVRTRALHHAVMAIADERSDVLDRPLQVLDLGGGTGGVAVTLAARGHDVTVIDPSPDALASLARRATEHGVSASVHGVQGDGDSLHALLDGRRIDLVCCHGTLEVVDDPAATLRAIREALGEEGRLSLAVAGRLAAVLARAASGELAEAKHILEDRDGRSGPGDPLARRFDVDRLEGLVRDAGLDVLGCDGLGTLSHLVPASRIESDADRRTVAELDDLADGDSPWTATLCELGAILHVVAGPASSSARH